MEKGLSLLINYIFENIRACLFICVDVSRLSQQFFNLINNAL